MGSCSTQIMRSFPRAFSWLNPLRLMFCPLAPLRETSCLAQSRKEENVRRKELAIINPAFCVAGLATNALFLLTNFRDITLAYFGTGGRRRWLPSPLIVRLAACATLSASPKARRKFSPSIFLISFSL